LNNETGPDPNELTTEDESTEDDEEGDDESGRSEEEDMEVGG